MLHSRCHIDLSIASELKKHVDAGHSKTCMMTALQLSCIKHIFLPDFRAASPSMRWELYGLLTGVTPPHCESSRLKHSLITSGQEASPSKQLEESSEPLIFFHSRPVSCWEGVATLRHAMHDDCSAHVAMGLAIQRMRTSVTLHPHLWYDLYCDSISLWAWQQILTIIRELFTQVKVRKSRLYIHHVENDIE